MKGFIEVTCYNQKVFLNISQIIIIQPSNTGLTIGVSAIHKGDSLFYPVKESYNDVKLLIEQAMI